MSIEKKTKAKKLMKDLRVKLTFIECVLGTSPGNKEVATTYIMSQNPDGVADDELDTHEDVQDRIEQKTTFFPKEDGKLFIWDYQIKGFFKDACSMLKRMPGSQSSEMKAHKKIIDGGIFPFPRKIMIDLSSEVTFIERPLRAQTPQGERIALARSEAVPAGSTIEFSIKVLNDAWRKIVVEWLDYGELRGIGQWRNSGMGRFTYKILG